MPGRDVSQVDDESQEVAMMSFRRTVALALFILVPVGRAQPGPDDDSASNLRDQIADAMPEADSANHKLQFGLELFDAVHAGIAMFELEGAVFGTTGALGTVGALGITAAVVAPLAAEAAVFVALGNAHAEAINSVIEDEIRSGFSRGVVLGADDRPASYIKENFVKHSPVRNSVYPEYGTKFQNAYNRALVAGYAQGRRLLESKAQRSAFFEDLYARMSVHPSVEHGEDQDAWSERTWTSYYIDCAAMFRLHHLK
jgi:hypothetical protein